MKTQRQTIRSILSGNVDPLPSIWEKYKPGKGVPPHLGHSEICANCPLTPDEVLSLVADALAGGCPGESQLEYRGSQVIEAHGDQPAKVSHGVRLYLTKDHPVTDTLLGVELSGDFAVTLPREILIDFHVVALSKVIDDVSNEERGKSRAIGVLERIWGNHLNVHAPSVEMIEWRGHTLSFAWSRLIQLLPLSANEAVDAVKSIIQLEKLESNQRIYDIDPDVEFIGLEKISSSRSVHKLRISGLLNQSTDLSGMAGAWREALLASGHPPHKRVTMIYSLPIPSVDYWRASLRKELERLLPGVTLTFICGMDPIDKGTIAH